MKRTLIIAACLFISCLSLAQQNDGYRFSVRLGAGLPGAGIEKFVDGINPGHYGLQGIYDDYFSDTEVIPPITAECLYQVNYWLNCGAEVLYSAYSNKRMDGITDAVKAERKGTSIIVMPSAHVSYYNKGALSLYMGVSVGAGIYQGFDNMKEKLSFEVEFVPIGVEFGGRVFCFAEACLGTAVNWAHGGIGFRF